MGTKKKLLLFLDTESEEDYLNDMSLKGYALTKLHALTGIFAWGLYEFEESKPGEYTYRVDIDMDKSLQEIEKYSERISKAEAEFLFGKLYRLYSRKKGTYNIFVSDADKIEYYKKKIDHSMVIIVLGAIFTVNRLIILNAHGFQKLLAINYILGLLSFWIFTFFIAGLPAIKSKKLLKEIKKKGRVE